MRQKNYVWVCYQPGSPAFYCDLLIFLYLGVLQIVGLILAFQTRKVKIPILNDSKFVAALVYISSVVFVALALVTFLLRDYINISNGTFSGGIMLLATIFLILMFVPKVWNTEYSSIKWFVCDLVYMGNKKVENGFLASTDTASHLIEWQCTDTSSHLINGNYSMSQCALATTAAVRAYHPPSTGIPMFVQFCLCGKYRYSCFQEERVLC